jgi:16S rRNA (guanine966-N2)-methyltransferase
MRIVAGSFRGRPLVAPKGHSTRPTADRTRQAIFNVLEHAAWAPDLDDARVIDLFAGTGAFGFEAISRGAAYALFIERDEVARGAIRANAESLGLEGAIRIDRRDAASPGTRSPGDGAAFDLALLDPPYGAGLGERALAGLAKGNWLADGATVVLERGSRDAVVEVAGFETLAERGWGVSRVSFLRFSPDAS